jgi:hypothetical protein
MFAGRLSGNSTMTAFGLAVLSLVIPMAGPAHAQTSQSRGAALVLPVSNPSDMQGVHTLLQAFVAACLKQGWSDELPKKLAPATHRVVNRDVYEYGKEGIGLPRAAIITPTGSADAGSNPGMCAVRWARPWAEHQKVNWRRSMLELGAATPIWSAFVLQGVPISKPPLFDSSHDRHTDLTSLLVPCFATSCRASVNWRYSADGIELTISRETAGTPMDGGARPKVKTP